MRVGLAGSCLGGRCWAGELVEILLVETLAEKLVEPLVEKLVVPLAEQLAAELTELDYSDSDSKQASLADELDY